MFSNYLLLEANECCGTCDIPLKKCILHCLDGPKFHQYDTVFPKGSNDRYTVGEFFSVPVFTNIIQDTMRKLKKTLKTKVANTKCKLFATILMHPAGLSWFKIMRPL